MIHGINSAFLRSSALEGIGEAPGWALGAGECVAGCGACCDASPSWDLGVPRA